MPPAPPRYDLVIFDLDGTLLDTLEDIADAANRVLRGQGLPTHPIDDYRYFVGDGIGQLVARMLPESRCSEFEIDRIAGLYREEYARTWNLKTRPFDGVEEMLGALADIGVASAVLSNKSEDFVRLCVEEYFPARSFTAVLGDHPSRRRKPDPEPALAIAKEVGANPARVMFVGDTGVDMETARAAGMFAVGVPWGFRPREELDASGAQVIIDKPADLLKLLHPQ